MGVVTACVPGVPLEHFRPSHGIYNDETKKKFLINHALIPVQ